MAIRRKASLNRRKNLHQRRKVRLAIECTPEERKFMKMTAAHEDKTLNEFVLECVRTRIFKCRHSHLPNKKTKAAMRAIEKGEDLISFDSVDDFLKSLKN